MEPPIILTDRWSTAVYMLNPGLPYSLPSLDINGSPALPPTALPHPGGQTGVISFPKTVQSQPASVSASARPYPPPTQRIAQVDGPSDFSGEENSPSPPGAYAPRTSHPSLPQLPVPSQSQPIQDSEAINGEIDDSDTEVDEEGAADETDIVFCTPTMK